MFKEYVMRLLRSIREDAVVCVVAESNKKSVYEANLNSNFTNQFPICDRIRK